MTVGEFFTAGQVLLGARCRKCGQLAAQYWQYHDDGRDDDGWKPRAHCDRAPGLPAGAELDALLSQARLRATGSASTRAPVTIRV